MARPEASKKKATRERMEALAADNRELKRNPTEAHMDSLALSGKLLKVMGIDHPVEGTLFPLSNCYINKLPAAYTNKTGHTHILQFHELTAAPHKFSKPTMKINLKDFDVQFLSNKAFTYLGEKYLAVKLTDSWHDVLLPVNKRLWFKERVAK